jgi:hypothetical protein
MIDTNEEEATAQRVFKTKHFAKTAEKAEIKDKELCEAIQEVMKGQADDLGGGVFKKRLNKNLHRSIILTKGENRWIYTYLFAKKDRDNIDNDELKEFRKLADGYAAAKDEVIKKALANEDLVEICHEHKEKLQK